MNLKLTSITIVLSIALSQSVFADSSRVYSSTGMEKNDATFTPQKTNNVLIDQVNNIVATNYNNGQSFDRSSPIANLVEKTYKDDTPQYKGDEDKAGKTLMCLLAGARAHSACKDLLRDYFKMVANPKKYGNPAKFLAKSPTRTGKAQSDSERSRQNQMDRYTKSVGENKKNVNDLFGFDISKFEKMSVKQSNSYVDSIDMNYGWKNKNSKFLGVDSEGNPKNYFSCDVDVENGLNTKMETKVERYRKHGRTHYRYYLRTLTEMPHNCSSLKAHYPMTILPEYDKTKCDGRWYDSDDYLRGYYLRTVGYNRGEPVYEKVKIDKECWYVDTNKQKAMEDNYKKAQENLLKQGMEEQWTADYLNTKMFNLAMPNQFKLPEPSNKYIK